MTVITRVGMGLGVAWHCLQQLAAAVWCPAVWNTHPPCLTCEDSLWESDSLC